jgi:hypothetical protein
MPNCRIFQQLAREGPVGEMRAEGKDLMRKARMNCLDKEPREGEKASWMGSKSREKKAVSLSVGRSGVWQKEAVQP